MSPRRKPGSIFPVALVALISILLSAGCKVDPFNFPVDFGSLTAEQRVVAMNDIAEKAHTLTGADVDERRQELLDYLWSRPEIEEAGESGDGSLWARFTDGRPLFIVANQPAQSPDDIPVNLPKIPETLGAGPSELPRGLQARFLLGGDKDINLTVNQELADLVRARGYTATVASATIEELKRVVGDHIFYFRGHSTTGRLRNGTSTFAIMSATKFTPANESLYKTDLDSLRLGYSLPLLVNLLPAAIRPDVYYAFTEQFVLAHMSFAQDSFTYLSACSAFAVANDKIKLAFLAKGAGVFWGWDNTFKDGPDNNASLRIFDRALGANTYFAPNPEQRPFDYESIKKWLARTGADKDPPNSATLHYAAGPNGPSGLLAPSIKFMHMDETNNTLYLEGKFGGEQGTVEVNGNPANIQNWSKEEIRLTMPVSGAGSSGPVVVISRGRRSNTRVLSAWRANFTLSYSPGSGDQKWEGTIKAHFRADVQAHRDSADGPVERRVVPFMFARDTEGELTASGSDPAPPNATSVRWRGTSKLKVRSVATDGNVIDGIGQIDVRTNIMRLAFTVTSRTGMVVVSSSGDSTDLPAGWAHSEGVLSPPSNPLPALVIPLGVDYEILADDRTMPVSPSPLLFWPQVDPNVKPEKIALRMVPQVAAALYRSRESSKEGLVQGRFPY